MALTTTDWIVIATYLFLNLLISLYYRRRSSGSTEEFFVSGRNVSWWLAGTSMVATTFAADTPLLVTGLVAKNGISGNWLWWSQCLSGMMTVFFFARYWRRSEILPDVEFVELRYGGRPAAFLRGFRALYLGALMNCLILGWVIKAMISITTVLLGDAIAQGRVLEIALGGHTLMHYTLGDPAHTALLICVLILVPFTGIYTFIGGLWGVLVTDLFQFILKMSMIIVLAWIAVSKLGGMTMLKIQLSHVDSMVRQSGQTTGSILSFFPSFHLGWTTDALWTLPVITFCLYLAVQWWASWYPGAEPGGGGYVAQRMFSAKDEKNSLLATLWFNIAHYAVRPWPWVLVALASLILFPGLADPETGYIRVMIAYLPASLRGLMIAAFAAAYMSTIATQLNWGASYLVNDFYRRFFKKSESERHYVTASQWATVFLTIISAVVPFYLDSIAGAWKLLLVTGAGTGGVLLLRWYWWRINAWSEVSAMISGFVVSLTMQAAFGLDKDQPRDFAWIMIVTVSITTLVWLAVTFLTRPESKDTLVAFYRRTHPSKAGWRPIAKLAPDVRPSTGGLSNLLDWICGCLLIYGILFGTGKLLLKEFTSGSLLLAMGLVAGADIYWDLSRRGWSTVVE